MSKLMMTAQLGLLLTASEAMAQSNEDSEPAKRLSISLGYGIGTASLSEYHDGVDRIIAENQAADPALEVDGDLKSKLQMNGELAVRYYGPHHLVGQIGVAGLYNKASATLSKPGFQSTEISADNIVVENSYLIGGYYPVHDRVTVYGMGGLALALKGWAVFDPSSDYEAGLSPGARLVVGSDFSLTDTLAASFEVGYRHLKASDLAFNKDSNVKFPNDPGGDEVSFDFSGITAQVNMRVFVF